MAPSMQCAGSSISGASSTWDHVLHQDQLRRAHGPGFSVACKETIPAFGGPGLVGGEPVGIRLHGGLQNPREPTVAGLEIRFAGGTQRPRVVDRFLCWELVGQALVVCPAQNVPVGSRDTESSGQLAAKS